LSYNEYKLNELGVIKLTRRQEQKEQTRKLLVEVAINYFAKDGLLATKTSDIAKAAGVAHGTVFVHFPTREDLVVAAIQEIGSRITSRIHQLALNRGSVREILEAHLEGLIEFEAFYTKLIAEGKLLPDAVQKYIIMIQSAISYHLMEVAVIEMEAGNIKQVPMHLLFNTWIGLIHHYLINHELFAPRESVLRRYKEELVTYFITLIAK
jgi:AcrR family transcriptional regulator